MVLRTWLGLTAVASLPQVIADLQGEERLRTPGLMLGSWEARLSSQEWVRPVRGPGCGPTEVWGQVMTLHLRCAVKH